MIKFIFTDGKRHTHIKIRYTQIMIRTDNDTEYVGTILLSSDCFLLYLSIKNSVTIGSLSICWFSEFQSSLLISVCLKTCCNLYNDQFKTLDHWDIINFDFSPHNTNKIIYYYSILFWKYFNSEKIIFNFFFNSGSLHVLHTIPITTTQTLKTEENMN